MSLETEMAEVLRFALVPLVNEIRELKARVEALAPAQFIPLSEAAERLDCDPRTITAMLKRGEIIGRRAGKRILILASSLKPTSKEVIAELADEARGFR